MHKGYKVTIFMVDGGNFQFWVMDFHSIDTWITNNLVDHVNTPRLVHAEIARVVCVPVKG